MYHYLMVYALILGGFLLTTGILLEQRRFHFVVSLILNVLGLTLLLSSILLWLGIHFELVTLERI